MPPVTALVLPSQVIGAAIQLITDRSWCQGQEPNAPLGGGKLNYARNAQGEVVRLFTGMADKAEINPDVYAMTAYAAITVVLNDRNTFLQQPQLLWDTVRQVALEQTPDIAVGGLNYLHPIHNLNEKAGQSESAIIAYLTTVKTRLAAVELPAPKVVASLPWAPPPGDSPAEQQLPTQKLPTKKLPSGKGSPRPQPTPTPKKDLPPPKVKSPTKRIKLKGKEPKAGTKVKGSEARWRAKQRGPR